ncbi:Glutathione peroxidase 2 [Smittium mucronatum]|uniref:Glutathione peroxidase n=1 Tax=Smittium mucronatum TaxID=133383 RepID=A0A1R0H2D4_9FUNG|nr:Glutathione peroxidase 2 [Smittium mucronatum]
MASKFYSLIAKDAKGQDYAFSQLKGKVVLIVNVASKCGFTPQYKDLEQLYKSHKDSGLVILGFPCNQFGSQEPGTQEEIASFCNLNYGVSFPIMEKIEVNGDKASPIYTYLKAEKPGLLGLKRIKWNFEKFLIDSNGKVVERFASTTNPSSIEPKIKSLISQIPASDAPAAAEAESKTEPENKL